jgi:hypothetical protein
MHTSFPEILRKHTGGTPLPFAQLLVNLGADDAFDATPQLRFLFQVLSMSGFYRRLCAARTVGETDELARDFAALTAFRPRFVSYLFRSFAYAMELTDEIPEAPLSDDYTAGATTAADAGAATAAEPETGYTLSPSSDTTCWDARWSDDRKRDFLTSLITVNRSNERRLGVKCAGACCAGFTQYEVRIAAELSRCDDPYATGDLHYAIYGHDGRVIDTGSAGAICISDPSPLPRAITVRTAPHLISSILLFWQ